MILYDRLVNEELLDYAKSDGLRIYCGKAPGFHSMPQESTERLMIKHAAAGSRCHDQASPVRWDDLAHSVDTLVIYMGVSALGEIREQLLKHGKDPQTPAALIEHGTTVRERTVTGTLGSIDKLAAALRISNPAIIIIGEVVKVREELLSLEKTVRSHIGRGINGSGVNMSPAAAGTG